MIENFLFKIANASNDLPQKASEVSQSASKNSMLMSFLPLVLIFFIFYFLLIRPQQKKAKEHNSMLANLKKGDYVLAGGLFGVIAKIEDDNIINLEIATGVIIKVTKLSVIEIIKDKKANLLSIDKLSSVKKTSKKSDKSK